MLTRIAPRTLVPLAGAALALVLLPGCLGSDQSGKVGTIGGLNGDKKPSASGNQPSSKAPVAPSVTRKCLEQAGAKTGAARARESARCVERHARKAKSRRTSGVAGTTQDPAYLYCLSAAAQESTVPRKEKALAACARRYRRTK